MSYLSQLCLSLSPYAAGEQPKDQPYIKLNTNENPYPPSPQAIEALNGATGRLRLYPDADASALCAALAKQNGVAPNQVFCGNGSDEVLGLAFAAFFAGKTLFAPDISYSFYPVYAQLFGANYVTVPLKNDFSVDVPALMQDGPIVLANPNAPTGRLLPLEQVRRLAKHTQAFGQVLLVDEAYAAFAPENALPLLKEFDNLLIVRTFSKSHGLAGLRVGYALGSPELIDALNRVKNSFNSYPVDCLAQAAALAAVEDTAYYNDVIARICQTRDDTADQLRQLGFEVIPSATNFLFVKADAENAGPIKDQLKAQGILVRHFNAPRIAPYLRISIGTPKDMQTVVAAMAEIAASK